MADKKALYIIYEIYYHLLALILNDEFPDKANALLRDLLEWPMEVNEGNKDIYNHIGSKGGSTGWILNDALYAEMLEGEKLELVLLTDDLTYFQSMLMGRNLNSFEAKLINDEDYRLEVENELSDS